MLFNVQDCRSLCYIGLAAPWWTQLSSKIKRLVADLCFVILTSINLVE
jgi:hypothetical protein